MSASTPASTEQARSVAVHDATRPALRREPIGVAMRGLDFVAAAAGLWRVVGSDGSVLGHIERRATAGGERFASRRLRPGGTSSVALGEFWSARDAAECFR